MAVRGPELDASVSTDTPDFIDSDPQSGYWTLADVNGRAVQVCHSTGANLMRALANFLNLPGATAVDARVLQYMDDAAQQLPLAPNTPIRQAFTRAISFLQHNQTGDLSDNDRAAITAAAIFFAFYAWRDGRRTSVQPEDVLLRADVIPLPIGSPPDDDHAGPAIQDPVCYSPDQAGDEAGGVAAAGGLRAAEAPSSLLWMLLPAAVAGGVAAKRRLRRR